MTKYAAIQAFFEGFDIPAFPESTVPTSGDEKPAFPYLTYSFLTGAEMDVVQSTASLYYRSESVVDINAKTEEISAAVGNEKRLACDGGGMIIRKGTPFAQPLADPEDDMIKRKVLLFEITFATIT